MAKSIRAIEALEKTYRKISDIHFCGFPRVDKESVLIAIDEQIVLEKEKK